MNRISALIVCVLLAAPVGGCGSATDPCREFDPPPGHKPSSCPSKPPPPAADKPAQPARYCYSSLAQVDCYSEPQPGRTGFLGSTPAYTPPDPAATAPAAKSGADKSSKPAVAPVTPAAPAPAPAPQ